jgi:hypothetical protein
MIQGFFRNFFRMNDFVARGRRPRFFGRVVNNITIKNSTLKNKEIKVPSRWGISVAGTPDCDL